MSPSQRRAADAAAEQQARLEARERRRQAEAERSAKVREAAQHARAMLASASPAAAKMIAKRAWAARSASPIVNDPVRWKRADEAAQKTLDEQDQLRREQLRAPPSTRQQPEDRQQQDRDLALAKARARARHERAVRQTPETTQAPGEAAKP
jgi:hypothetical protein